MIGFLLVASLNGVHVWIAAETGMDCHVVVGSGQQQDPAEKWEPEIAKFEEQDRSRPPKKNGILFLGSSSIRKWNLEKWFAERNVLNRGFGGSQISDTNYFFERIVNPYQPRSIVFYAGDNDIARGKTPDRVVEDFRRFVQKVEKSLPQTKIIFVAIKPSISRWKLVGKMRQVNRRIKEMAQQHALIDFADIDTPMIGENNQPRKELFIKDGLHLNEAGYKVWYDVINPLLKKTTGVQ